ncbi:MAG: hypothetical protein P4L49_19550 [Desulfosporosinus sp.]|nr:hypothetical protein [Desulfosporosinus sp.]
METVLLFAFVAFIVIYLAVRLAINPLIPMATDIDENNQDYGLVKLRDIEVLNNEELKEIIEIYSNKSMENKEYRQLQKYTKVLGDLKKIAYFTDEEYMERMAKLKDYYNNN